MARRILLDFVGQRLVLAEARGTAQQVMLRQVRSFDLPVEHPLSVDANDATTAAFGSWLKERLSEAGIATGDAVCLLARDRVQLRPVRMPTCPPEELPALVGFEASMLSIGESLPAVVDFEAGPEVGDHELDVLLASVPERLAEMLREACKLAGVRLRAIGVRSHAVHAAWQQWGAKPADEEPVGRDATLLLVPQPPGGGEASAVAAMPSPGPVEVSLWRSDHLLLSRWGRITASGQRECVGRVASEVRRTISAYQTHAPEVPLVDRRVVVCGEGLGEFASELEGELGRLVDHFDPLAAGFVTVEGGDESASLPALVPLAGAAALEFSAGTWPVDLAKPKRPRVARKTERWIAGLVASLALILVVGIVMGVRSRLSALDQSIELAQRKQNELRGEVAALQPDLLRHQAVRGWVDERVEVGHELEEIAARFPDTTNAYLTKLELNAGSSSSPGSILLGGRAATQRVITEMETRWATDPDDHFAVEPGDISTDEQSKAFPWRFDMRLEATPLAAADYEERLTALRTETDDWADPPGRNRVARRIEQGSASRPTRSVIPSRERPSSSTTAALSGGPAKPAEEGPKGSADASPSSGSESERSRPESGGGGDEADSGDPVANLVNKLRALPYEEREAKIREAPRFLQNRIREKLKESSP